MHHMSAFQSTVINCNARWYCKRYDVNIMLPLDIIPISKCSAIFSLLPHQSISIHHVVHYLLVIILLFNLVSCLCIDLIVTLWKGKVVILWDSHSAIIIGKQLNNSWISSCIICKTDMLSSEFCSLKRCLWSIRACSLLLKGYILLFVYVLLGAPRGH